MVTSLGAYELNHECAPGMREKRNEKWDRGRYI